ncbi:MAG: cell division protein FtsQ/DivIB [Burkholderiaceae bacterium]|nr:cell division protein FtsQ/DivIB [Burkholderiaceae bacterium]
MSNPVEMPFDIKVLTWAGTFLYVLFILMVLIGLITWMVASTSLNLRGMVIRGDVFHHNAASFRTSIVPNLKGNFYTINMNHAQNAFEALPWVSKASVKRVFPQRIEVILKEHKAVALWGMRDDSKMVSNSGLVFDSGIDDEESESFPQFIGPEGQSELMLSMYRHLIPILEPLSMKLVKLELSMRGSWSVVLDGGAIIELGRGSVDMVSERVKRFSRTLGQVVSKFNRGAGALQYADLRHSDGYALRLNGVSTGGVSDATSLVKK